MTSNNPQSEIPNSQSSPIGRPRKLDDAMRREICALVAGGCGLREAARYVRCSVKTIRRETDRNAEFHEQLRRSEMYAQLSPLRAMQHACSTHWRAAAWFLERAYPDRFSRPDPGTLALRQVQRLLDEVLRIVSSEVPIRFQYESIEKRLRAAFEYSIRAARDRRRSARDLRREMSFCDDKSAADDPIAQLGFPLPDFESLFKPLAQRATVSPTPATIKPTAPAPSPQPPAPSDRTP